MKYSIILALFLVIFNYGSAQTLQHKYTPYIYLGASKSVLTDLVVETAKAWYEKDLDGVVNKQRKKGVKLKKKEALDAFIGKMQASIRYKLEQSNYWQDSEVDLRAWDLSLEDILGMGFNLPGFIDRKIKLHPGEREFVILHFRNGGVNFIYTTITVATMWDTKGYPYDNQSLQRCINVLNEVYGKNYNHSRIAGEGYLGEKPFPSYREILSYNTNAVQMDFQFYYGPCGLQDKAGNWRHAGTSLQTITFNVQSK